MYIVIEGQDGTGKSTQAQLLAEHLEKQEKTVVVLDEPDGDLPQAHIIHDLILTGGYGLEPATNVLLFTAARSELWHKIAEPALDKGGYVISARNWWSTLAYQGHGEGISLAKIRDLTAAFLPKRYLTPDLSAILTVSDAIREQRQSGRGKAKETFEQKPDSFQQKVNAAYPKIAKEFNIPIIDAAPSITQVQSNLRELFNL